MPTRRVVTGHDSEGRSVFLSDGPVPVSRTNEDMGIVFDEVWNTETSPVPIHPAGDEPTDRPLRIPPVSTGTKIRVNEFLPGHVSDGIQSPMHRTESIDYGIVLEGEMTLILTDAEVTVRAGDIVVQRGTDHAWANRTDRSAKMAFVLVGGEFGDDLRALLPGGGLEAGVDEITDAT
jgi:mannose-6-phosphate isomerase-like protein (cupin superfamily)